MLRWLGRRPRGGLSLAALLGSVNAACANTYPAPRPPPAELSAGAPPAAWSARAGSALTAPVAADDSTLFVAGMDRKVYALDLRTGKPRWSARLPGVIPDGVLRKDTLLYAGTGRPEGRVDAMVTRTGRRIWRANTGNVSAPLALMDGTLVVQTRTGTVLGLDPRTGVIRWRRRLGIGRAAAVAAGDSSFVVATLDSLFRVSARDGRVLVRRRSPGPIVSTWRLDGSRLLAGTGDSLVVAIGSDSLTEVWRTRLDAPVLVAPALVGDTVFAVSRIGTVYRIAAGTGETTRVAALHWPVTAAPVARDSLLLVGGADGTLRALRRDGSEEWRLALWDPVPIAPLLLGDAIVAFGGNGDLKLLRP